MEPVKAGERGPRDIVSTSEKAQKEQADHRHITDNLRSHLRREERQFVPWKQVAAEAESQNEDQQSDAAEPGYFPRPCIRAREIHAGHMDEERQDHQIRRPAVKGPDEPSELHLRHDELNAFECRFGGRPVIKKKQNSCDDLNGEKKQGHSAEVIPDRVPVNGNRLLVNQFPQRCGADSFIQPAHTRETTISSPRTLTEYAVSGFGGGPPTFFPFKSNWPP